MTAARLAERVGLQCRPHGLHRADLTPDHAPEDLRSQVALALEVSIDRSGSDARAGGDGGN